MAATSMLPLSADVSLTKAAIAVVVGWLLWLDYKRASISVSLNLLDWAPLFDERTDSLTIRLSPK